jgi:hypothetical protein
LLAAVAMVISSLTVLANSLWLQSFRDGQPARLTNTTTPLNLAGFGRRATVGWVLCTHVESAKAPTDGRCIAPTLHGTPCAAGQETGTCLARVARSRAFAWPCLLPHVTMHGHATARGRATRQSGMALNTYGVPPRKGRGGTVAAAWPSIIAEPVRRWTVNRIARHGAAGILTRRVRALRPPRGGLAAVGQVKDSPWRETHRTRGQAAPWC